MPNYAEPARLKELVAKAQQSGTISEELALVLIQIAEGLYKRYHFTGMGIDDFSQNFVLLVMQKINNIRLNGSIFGFLTTCAFNSYRASWRWKAADDKKTAGLRQKLEDDGQRRGRRV